MGDEGPLIDYGIEVGLDDTLLEYLRVYMHPNGIGDLDGEVGVGTLYDLEDAISLHHLNPWMGQKAMGINSLRGFLMEALDQEVSTLRGYLFWQWWTIILHYSEEGRVLHEVEVGRIRSE